MPSGRGDRLRAALGAALALLALGASASAGATPANVAVGGVPSPSAGATALGTLAPATPLALTVVLDPRDPAGLTSLATAVATPGSPAYHHYLSVGQFAARFGASAGAVAAVRDMLRSDGLTPGALAPNGLSMDVSASAAQASQAFGVRLRRYREPTGQLVYANTAAPRVPAALGGVVADVVGLDNLQAAAPASLREAPAKRVAHAAAVQPFSSGGGPAPCAAASNLAGPSGPYTINQVAAAYGMDGLYASPASGHLGAGVTVALYELESYAAADLNTFQACFATNTSVTNITVDGGPATDSKASAETAIDLANVIGLAPQSKIVVYQGPNSGHGPYDTLARIVNDDTAQVISDSWGQCEPDMLAGDVSTLYQEDNLFKEAAVQGQTVIVSSGDRGSNGCRDHAGLAVSDASSQPYATGVGGTRLNTLSPPASETVWTQNATDASGGGVSSFWAMPSYQALSGVTGVFSPYSGGAASAAVGSPCAASSGYCREVPDVSANAAPATGYVVYWSGSGGWSVWGGTSGSAPVWAGLIALADASGIGGCTPANPLGFLNPLLYQVAAGAGHANALNDITSGSNQTSGADRYPATPGYDMASGLGTPIADGPNGLVAQLCAAANAEAASPPAVSGLSVHDAAPGAAITVSGSNFTPSVAVWFGATASASVTLISSNQLSAVVPPGSGTVDVTVTAVAAVPPNPRDVTRSTTGSGDVFTYAPTEAIGSPVAGAAYTQTQPLVASYSCAASTPAAVASCGGSVANGALIDTSSLGPHQFSVTATDTNGASTTATATYTVIPRPAIAINAPAPGAIYTQGQPLTAQFSCASSTPATIASCAAPVPNGTAIDTGAAGVHSFTVGATDSNGVTSTQTATYTVVPPPVATIKRPENGARYLRGAKVAVAFHCGATAPQRIVSCVATRRRGAAIDTATLGAHHFTLRATDANGVTTTQSVKYVVVAVHPSIASPHETSSTWLEHHVAHSRLAVGTTFRFSLDQTASVTLQFARIASGRMAAGRCVSPRLVAAVAPQCTRSLNAGKLTFRARSGTNKLRFLGRTSNGRLAPGSYSVRLRATGLSGRPSGAVSLRFVIA